jgi:phosphate transport system ATP-binding protein
MWTFLKTPTAELEIPASAGPPPAVAQETAVAPGPAELVGTETVVMTRQLPAFWRAAAERGAAATTIIRTLPARFARPSGPSSPAPVATVAVPPRIPAAKVPATVPEPKTLASLEARDITAWFGDHQVLDRVSLTMPAGVVTALIGPSGCGKSTFLRILNRMHELVPSASLAGEVLLDGEDIYGPQRKLVDARKSIGMVFQKPNPFPAMSIFDNVIAGLRLTGASADRDLKDHLVETSLTRAGLWKEVKDRLRAPGGGLSGGQQQRLCIARALAITPRVLLMDEPCSALDPTSTRVIEETMLELVADVTIVIVTHNMQQAQRVSTQCAFFLASQGKPGAIVEHGDTEAMFGDPLDSRTADYVHGRFG